ncbi:16S rRNA (guanine(527)-N(7))-methyltransferase RsmG [Paenibacillus sp. 1011MAR3C5]|uniref:16S rRNA (guanine(527)-N(7))-methyltransferase RsmG n=1 Tax=Paenibacillus sp. 1011MAR3C5 TaxID=1675787 RepID=UPI000E6B737C|nr:16S rRNA (guanine(527)-N(7))-methyltransferase RsmG [Paenibacillus sp. 1011MAR3C5]RJE83312.1 16S rRNA (guanine(527)-N(7))-methyltransferase RsmG [Paenibacillus sp. 1011MAR3C5]
MDKTTEWFTQVLKERGIPLSEQQLQQFELYYTMLVDWNERMNLTGITERDAVYEKHFYDSVSLAFYTDVNKVQRLADIGSGAGFPSIPLKICFPHVNVLIVDSLNKRIGFLKALSEQLGLSGVECVHGRAEDIARLPEHRDQYDLVTARAVARLNVLNEFCLPFVKKGGLFAAMKGAQSDGEVREASFSLRELKGKLLSQHAFSLPNEQSERHIVLVEKKDITPKKYPRKAGTPLKQPLL